MSVIITATGMFNVSGSMPLTPQEEKNITDLFGGTSIAAIALTVFNFFAAVLAIIFILTDNRRVYRRWKISPSNRIPLVLAAAICISHVFFMMKAFIGLASFQSFNPPKSKQVPCDVSNQLGFWGTSSSRAQTDASHLGSVGDNICACCHDGHRHIISGMAFYNCN